MRELGLSSPDFAGLATEILQEGNVLCFVARGVCMRPFIEDGDVLHVQPLGSAVIRCGEVLLCRSRDGRMVAHRAIKTGSENGREMVVTKGDALACPDGPIPEEQVLGRVVSVVRRGKCLRLDRGGRRWMTLLLIGLWRFKRGAYCALSEFGQRVLA